MFSDYPGATGLSSEGSHFVLLSGRTKRPLHKAWQVPANAPSLERCLAHLESGGMLGLVPASLGLTVLDYDGRNEAGLEAFKTMYPPLAHIRTQRGSHLYYNAETPVKNKNGIKLFRYDLDHIDIRSRNGYVVLWDLPAVADLVAARAFLEDTSSLTKLPWTLLGLKAAGPWEAHRYGPEGAVRSAPAKRPRRALTYADSEEFGTTAFPDPPDSLRSVQKGGRNVAIFDAVRSLAYKLARGGEDAERKGRWHRYLLDYARMCNDQLVQPLRESEIVSTAKSVATWTWEHPDFGRFFTRTPEDQARRGRASGEARRRRNCPRNRRIVKLWQTGKWSMSSLAPRFKLSRTHIWRIIQKFLADPDCYINPSAARGDVGQGGGRSRRKSERSGSPGTKESHSLRDPAEIVAATGENDGRQAAPAGARGDGERKPVRADELAMRRATRGANRLEELKREESALLAGCERHGWGIGRLLEGGIIQGGDYGGNVARMKELLARLRSGGGDAG